MKVKNIADVAIGPSSDAVQIVQKHYYWSMLL